MKFHTTVVIIEEEIRLEASSIRSDNFIVVAVLAVTCACDIEHCCVESVTFGRD